MADELSRPWRCTRSPGGHHEIIRRDSTADHCKWCGIVPGHAIMDELRDPPVPNDGRWHRWKRDGPPLPISKAKNSPSANTREFIHTRDQWLCRYCGKQVRRVLALPFRVTIDHLIPRSKGGTNDRDNLVTACWPCNHLKADRTPEEAGMPLLPIGTFRIAYKELSPG